MVMKEEEEEKEKEEGEEECLKENPCSMSPCTPFAA